MSRSLAINFTVTSFVTAAQVSAAFAPVPWLSPAVGVLTGIVEICQKIETNRRNVQLLGQRCVYLVQGLCDFGEQSGVTNIQIAPQGPVSKALADTLATLSGILDSMRAWSQLGLGKRLLMQDVIMEDIKRSNGRIDDCLNLFMMKAQIDTANWQTSFEQKSNEDHEETMLYLTEISNNQALIQNAQNVQAEDNMRMMAMMQTLLSKFEIGDHRHIGLQSNMYDVQRESRQLLPNLDLRAGEVRRLGSYPVGGSPAFDIWEGMYLDREKCAIKVIRGINNSPNAQRRFKREVEIWRSIWEQDKGTYILPFWGVCQTDGPYPYMVSPWMSQGDVLTYVKRYPYADRMAIIRRVARGLKILHSQTPPIAHGDLKAINVLINDHHDALLADFGLSKVLEDITGVPFTQSRGVSDSYRWFAPELCCAPGVITLGSDVFAFGMTILEILTGEQPFASIRRTTEVLIRMQDGQRPERPADPEMVTRGLDDNVWNLLQDCWAHESSKRPPIDEVIARLG